MVHLFDMTTPWKLVLVSCILFGQRHIVAAYAPNDHFGEYTNTNWVKRDEEFTDNPLEQSVVPAVIVETTTPYHKEATDDKESTNNFVKVGNTAGLRPSASYLLDSNIINVINKNDLEQILFHFDGADDNSCLLGNIKTSMMWWTFPNGTLRRINFNIPPIINYVDLSYRHISSDDALYVKIRALEVSEIVVFSVAYNNLTSVPHRTLDLISRSLKYLTLSGNNFYPNTSEPQSEDKYSSYGTTENDQTEEFNGHQRDHKLFSKNGEGIAWAQFPYLPNLIELDLSNCRIEYVTKEAFRNISNLKSLYMSHNKMLTIPFDTFYYVQSLHYLDLSYTNVFDYNIHVSMPTLEAIINMIYGLKIQQTTFKYLPNIVYLDLSHTKLTRNSAVAFAHLGEKLKYLSLCYTAFPMIGNALFKNTSLVGLDLSGNTYAAYNIIDDAFEGISDTLSVLYFERSNLKDISWINCLSNLKVLGLAGNNINSLTFDMFSPLTSLQVLDLGINHVGNWYSRVFTNNNDLRILNLRDNNINIITSEMLKDFSLLDYLSIGDNNFVCDCTLRDLVDLATAKPNKPNCARDLLEDARDLVNYNLNLLFDNRSFISFKDKISKLKMFELNRRFGEVNISSIIMLNSIKLLKHRVGRVGAISTKKYRSKMRFMFRALNATRSLKTCLSSETESDENTENLNRSLQSFKLLDYQEERYWCFNETEKLSLLQLTCNQRSFTEEIENQLHSLTIYVISFVCTLLGISIIGVVIYFKRWHIYYYYSSLKSAALVSEAVKENVDKFNTLSQQEAHMLYDIFISYCQNDRDWVLEHLMPNIEENEDISICLHERDFQIGVTILDNIISCMDRSRALMLIISSNFLLSHWCQFEMHLAQHRIFDVRNDHLILVFLEDIPRNKRPKNLQYLMDVKTYIKWPGAKTKKEIRADEYKLFWKRLKRALSNISK